MEIYERVRILRKEYLKLSQTEFAEKLGVTRTVIKNIELNVLAKPEQKLSLIKLMCKEFNVSEDWLLNGEGEMFVTSDEFDLNKYMDSIGSSPLEKELIRTYFDLDKEVRKEIMEHFKCRLISAIQKDPTLLVPDDPEILEQIAPPIEVDSLKNDVS